LRTGATRHHDLSDLISQAGQNPAVAALDGPSHARELAVGKPELGVQQGRNLLPIEQLAILLGLN